MLFPSPFPSPLFSTIEPGSSVRLILLYLGHTRDFRVQANSFWESWSFQELIQCQKNSAGSNNAYPCQNAVEMDGFWNFILKIWLLSLRSNSILILLMRQICLKKRWSPVWMPLVEHWRRFHWMVTIWLLAFRYQCKSFFFYLFVYLLWFWMHNSLWYEVCYWSPFSKCSLACEQWHI